MKYLSFRFDDGFFEGARKADALLAPDRGSFFLVTGLVEKTHGVKKEPLFSNRDFGTLEQWTALSRAGHDIQAHSVSHARFSEISREEQIAEATGSLETIKKIHSGPYIFCFPYNAIVDDLNFQDMGFAASGFYGRGAENALVFNDLAALDPHALRGSMVFEEELDWLTKSLAADIPDQAWVILGFHSFDGEGHRPWSSAGFSLLVSEVRRLGYQVKTISNMIVNRLATEPSPG